MKRFWYMICLWICTIGLEAEPDQAFSPNFLENYSDQFLYEQKKLVSLTQITTPPPTGYVPFTIVNNSTFPDNEIFILILTNNFNNIITFARNADNLQVGTVTTPPPKTYVSDQGSGTYPLSTFATPQNGEAAYTFYLPSTVSMTASRIYYSIGEPLDWFIPVSGPVAVPSQDFADPAQDGFYILFDKQEFTMDANNRLIMNPTLVDYYGLPLSFSIEYTDYTQSTPPRVTAFAGLPPTLPSTTIFSNFETAIASLPTSPNGGTRPIWNSLYLTYAPPSGTSSLLRILAPSQAIQTTSPVLMNPIFPINYFLTNNYTSDNWLSQVWFNGSNNAIYQIPANTLFIDLSTAGPSYGIAQGSVDTSGNFNFTAISGTGTGSTLVLPLPTSSKAFFTSTLSDYTPTPTITGDSNVANAIWQGLSAGIISGIVPLLGTSQSNPLSQSFIRQQTLFVNNPNITSGPWYDFYSGTFINMGSSPYTKFYTTPYGDYLGTDGTVTVTQIAQADAVVTVTIGNMAGIAVPNPFNDNNTYTVTFNALPSDVTVTFGSNPDFSSNPMVSSTGETFNSVPGGMMYLGVTYNTGSYTGRIWGTHIIPSGPAPKPVLPGGLSLMLSGGVGGTLTITVGASPP